MEIRSFSDLFKEATAYHMEGAKLFADKDRGYQRFFAEADRRYKDLLRTEPDNEQVLFLRGTLDLQSGDSGRAIALLEKCVRVNPSQFDAWNNLGAAWRQEHRNTQAMECYAKALELKPEEADILANLCAIAVNEGKPEEGIPYGERCLAINPKHPQGRWNLGLLYLEAERYDEGFRLYNEGFETGDRILRSYTDKRGVDVPLWDGFKPEEGSTIVVWGEQGRGDELLWMQFVPCLRGIFDRVIIDCHPGWYKTIKRSFPWATVFPTRKSDAPWAANEEIHYKQSIASLPAWFHEHRRANCGWLKPDMDKVWKIRTMIGAGQKALGETGRPVVGIHWLGGRHKTRVDLRSVNLDAWKGIMDLPVSLVSHQYHPQAFQEAAHYPTRIMHWQAITGDQDLDWNAALVHACDILISVNTTAVHIAGAMDKQCWTMTPFGHAWRYGRARDLESINPFYRSVHQYNQQEDETWESVMERVTGDVNLWLRTLP